MSRGLRWIVAAVVVVSVTSGCGKKGAGSSGSGASVTVNVDNGTADEWDAWVDGHNQGRVRPFGVLAFKVTEGKHELKVTRGGVEVDRMDAELTGGYVWIFNPGAKNAYYLTCQGYGRKAQARTSVKVPGQRLMKADVGLGEGFPSVTVVPNRGGDAVGSLSRLTRQVHNPVSIDEALALLSGEARGYVHQSDDDRTRVLKTLTTPPLDPRLRDTVVRAVEAHYDPFTAFFVASQTGLDLPPERLIAWLAEARDSSDEKVKSRAADTFSYLMRIKSRILLERFDSFSLDQQKAISGLLGEWPADATLKVLGRMIDDPSDRFKYGLLDLVRWHVNEFDDAFARRVDAYIERVTDPESRRDWLAVWSGKIFGNRARLSRAYLDVRILDFERKGVHVEPELLAGFAEAQLDSGVAARSYATWPDAARYALVKSLATRFEKRGSLTSAESALAFGALHDAGGGIRDLALTLLCGAAASSPATLQKLNEEIRAEKDGAQRELMEGRLAHRLASNLSARTPEELVALACQSPNRAATVAAVRALLGRKKGVPGLAEALATVPAEHRAWIMQTLGEVGPTSDQVLAVIPVLDRGLADADSRVQAAAAASRMAVTSRLGPDAGRIWKAVAATKDDILPRVFERWAQGCLSALESGDPESIRELRGNAWKGVQAVDDPEMRKQLEEDWRRSAMVSVKRINAETDDGFKRLLELASAPEEVVARAAVEELPNPNGTSPDRLSAIVKVYGSIVSPARRTQLLERVRSNAGHPGTMALCEEALKDKEAGPRLFAFEILVLVHNDLGRDDKKALPLLKRAAAAERDAETKKKMDALMKTLSK